MDKNRILNKLHENFRSNYPSATSGDWQTFYLGLQAGWDAVIENAESNNKAKLANDIEFFDAIFDAESKRPPMAINSFNTIGGRAILIEELEKKGFKIIKIK